MRIDVNAFLGAYPFRRVPGTSPEALIAAMDRMGIDEAWVTHLPGVFWRDPAAGTPGCSKPRHDSRASARCRRCIPGSPAGGTRSNRHAGRRAGGPLPIPPATASTRPAG